MRKNWKGALGVNSIRSADGNVANDPKGVQKKWRVYVEDLLNFENSNIFENTPAVLSPIEEVSVKKVSLALRCMKSGKASGLPEVTTEMFVIAGYQGTDMLCSVYLTTSRRMIHRQKSGLKALQSPYSKE